MIGWIIGGVLAAAIVLWGPIVSNVEQAKYTVAEKNGDIEIRDYAPMIVAEAEVHGERNGRCDRVIYSCHTKSPKVLLIFHCRQYQLYKFVFIIAFQCKWSPPCISCLSNLRYRVN